MCDHQNAKCVETEDPSENTGHFSEHYECPCGATGTIYGKEEQPPNEWDKVGEVFS